jgi:glycosyltransferase involved in cell wall biosynthesis
LEAIRNGCCPEPIDTARLSGGRFLITRPSVLPESGRLENALRFRINGQFMRIAQVAPLYESVPPKLYGGTERIVSWLTEELVGLGHEVTLFASGDSMTTARLVPACPQALRLNPLCTDQLAHHVNMLERVFSRRDEFDLVHFHIDYLHFPLTRQVQLAQVTTLHGRLDLPELAPLYLTFSDMPVVSISDAQQRPLPWANWQATVHHGLPKESLGFYGEPGKYLAFLGRTSPEKGLDQAIQIAKRVGMPLKIAAKVDRADEQYFETVIKPLLNDPLVEFIGEIGYSEKMLFWALLRPCCSPSTGLNHLA